MQQPTGAHRYTDYDHAAQYLHVLSRPAWEQLGPRLRTVLTDVDPAAGTVLELGPGTGLGTQIILETVPRAPVVAAEPSAALRAVLLGRIADHAGAQRLTVYPAGATRIPLPDRLCAVVGLHMIGHLQPDSRRQLWAALRTRLTEGAVVVINIQPPDRPVTIPPGPAFATVIQGELTYEGYASAEPTGPDCMLWQMRYVTRHGAAVVDEANAEYLWWTLSASELADELAATGLKVTSTNSGLVIARPGRASQRG